MKKVFPYIFACFTFPLLVSCNATPEDVIELNKQRDILDSVIISQQNISRNLAENIQNLNTEKLELSQKVELLEAEVSNKKVTYILGLEVSIRKGLELTTTDANFEIPVPKEFYESAKIGQELDDVSGSRAFSLSIHSAGCKIEKKRTFISK